MNSRVITGEGLRSQMRPENTIVYDNNISFEQIMEVFNGIFSSNHKTSIVLRDEEDIQKLTIEEIEDMENNETIRNL